MFISALRFETRTLRPRFLYKFFLITPPVCISLHTSSFVRPLQPLALRDFQRYVAFSFAAVFGNFVLLRRTFLALRTASELNLSSPLPL